MNKDINRSIFCASGAVLAIILTTWGGLFLTGCPSAAAKPADKPAVEAAADGKKTVAELTAERDVLKAELAAKNAEIDSARQAGRERACQWTAGALAVLALLASIAAYFLPGRRLKLAGLAGFLLALAAASLFIGKLVPYWEWIGAGVILAGVIGGILAWRNDHKMGEQVVGAVQDFRDSSTDLWARARPFFNSRIDSGVKARIEKLVKSIKGKTP